eukprot:tig00020902_g14952.t1
MATLHLRDLGAGGHDPAALEEARARRRALVRGKELEGASSPSASGSPSRPALLPEEDELRPRTPEESQTQVILPFSTDEKLRDQYISFYDGLRFGRILEDMDVFAYRCAMRHITVSRPLTVVTGAFDRVLLVRRLDPHKDLRMRGNVSWVGRSSVEVTIECCQKDEGGHWALNLRATVLMVSLDRGTQKPVQVNPLNPITERDRELYSHGSGRQEYRKQDVASSLKTVPPTPEELAIIHSLFTASNSSAQGGTTQDWVHMDATALESVVLMHPQKRNIHGKIFGGYVMRLGFDLAWSVASLHLRTPVPVPVVVDDIHFLKPALVGTLVSFRGKVVYTPPGGETLQVQVTADQLDVDTGKRTLTTALTFTFGSPGPEHPVRPVVPRTYGEAMEYIEARRRFSRTREFMRALCGEATGGTLAQYLASLSPRPKPAAPRGSASSPTPGPAPLGGSGAGTAAA